MSAISTLLTRLQNTLSTLRAAIWAIDVRDDIADAIEECGQMVEQCYSDVSNPTLQTEALEAALQNKIDQGEMAALTIGDRTITAVKLANGVIPAADATLTTSGGYADAAETGRQIGNIKADLGAQVGVFSKTEGYYINLTTDPVSLTPQTTATAGMAFSIIECVSGDKFVINAVGGNSGRAWGFLDSSDHVLLMADANATVTGLELTAPANAVKLIINDKSGGMSYKVGNNIVSKMGDLSQLETESKSNLVSAINEAAKSGLTDEAKDALLDCFEKVAWKSETIGRIAYNALRDALYPVQYPIIGWDYSVGRLPSEDDGIATTINSANISVSYNAQSGIKVDHTNNANDTHYARFDLIDYPTCTKGYFEYTINIISMDSPANVDVRISDGTSGLKFNFNNAGNVRVYNGSTASDYVIIHDISINTNTWYTIRCEYDKNGTNKIFINNILIYEGTAVSSYYVTANRFYVSGKNTCYIKNIEWGIMEV